MEEGTLALMGVKAVHRSYNKSGMYSEEDLLFERLQLQSEECEWKELPKNMNHQLHTICSYMAMFPPSVPHYFITQYSKPGDIVLDTFSGRGTTVLEACLANRIGIGNDLNPLAYVLSKAKSNVPQKPRVYARISELERQFKSCSNISLENEDPHIRMIFSDNTLKQLIFLKRRLTWKGGNKSNVDTFIVALLLGIIHGGSEGYLSLQMPNTFSMSPNYVKNYIAKHGLKRPERNAFDLLRRKLERCYQRPYQRGLVYRQDARKMTRIKDGSINLIITSQPYTHVIRYGQFNWIRLWFLGEKGKEVDKELFFSQSVDKYCVFMSDVLREMSRVLKKNGKVVLVIGDVKDRTTKQTKNLAEIVWERCAAPLGFHLVKPIKGDVISGQTKVSRIWGTKKGKATKVDRILILEK